MEKCADAMAKFTNPSKISKEEKEKLLIFLCEAICNIKNPTEAAKFLGDILSSQEAKMIAKRLKIAQMLIEGKKYAEISYDLKVSANTISRVFEWLKISGEGFRIILERQDKKTPADQKDNLSLFDLKKKYPLYYWSQILLESIIKSANSADRRRLRIALKSMDRKTELYKQISRML